MVRVPTVLAVLVALVVTYAGAPALAVRAPQPVGATFVRSVLTDEGPRMRLRPTPDGRIVVRGRTDDDSPDANSREVFRRPGARQTGPQTSCATWVKESGPSVQEGLAVRIRDRAGRVRAVTVTKNVEFGLYWFFNLVTWDTARRGVPWRGLGQFDMAPVIGLSATSLAPMPWRVCLRAVGRTVAFKVWLPEEESEPSWDDETHVHAARLPRGYAVGRPGWYVGHVPAGGRVVYDDLTTRSVAP